MAADEADLALFVRDGDYERFLSIQLAPPADRPALYAVTAVSVELARVAEVVSDALLGHIRLAWWREALEEIAAGKPPRNHPVVLALAAIYPAHPSVMAPLLRMVEARAMDLDAGMTASDAEWLAYLDGTAGALHAAWATVLDPQAVHVHAEHIAQQARAYAMVGLVRAIPYHAAHGCWRFPPTRMAEDAEGEALHAAVLSLTEEALRLLHTHHDGAKKYAPLGGLAILARMHGRRLLKQRGNFRGYGDSRLPAAIRIAMKKISSNLSILC